MSQCTAIKLTCFGEALIDLLPGQHGAFLPIVGGAPANAAVGFAKLGGTAEFLGGLATDGFAQQIRSTLDSYGVSTMHCPTIAQTNTALAVVTLDENNERQFSFYRNQTADLMVNAADFAPFQWPEAGVFHFCSNTLTTSDIRQTHMALLEQAFRHHQLISFDVNLRLALWPDVSQLSANIEACFKYSDILKFSLEELECLCQTANTTTQQYCHWLFALGVKLILISNGQHPVQLLTKKQQIEIATPTVQVTDTTGAGDSLISGFLFYLAKLNVHKTNLVDDIDKLEQAAKFAVKCGAHTCTQLGVMQALPTLEHVS
ncbi:MULTISPECIES: carbohydrate kinase family protein [Pseudoalteromonas]|uniref:carbohydrate kinase family protein n=1 Tax=Pseudoalteromonas TaxID=53246 RepID=UPI000A499909|nr:MULTISPECIES: carbohydrate kinase [Pseudoalteromonas]